jgi:CRISPR-associated protein Cas2
MMVLVCYDVDTTDAAGCRRLRQVARACQNLGQRVQNSVFECLLEPAQWAVFRANLLELADLELDSLRFYMLGKNWKKRVEHHGAKPTYDPQGVIIV